MENVSVMVFNQLECLYINMVKHPWITTTVGNILHLHTVNVIAIQDPNEAILPQATILMWKSAIDR